MCVEGERSALALKAASSQGCFYPGRLWLTVKEGKARDYVEGLEKGVH